MKRILNYLFPLVKEIKSKEGVLHFRRYRIFETPWLSLYVHRIYESDKDDAPHSHPWKWFVNFVLWGSYMESLMDLRQLKYGQPPNWSAHKRSWNFGLRRPWHFHTNKVIKGPITSLFLVGPRIPVWGYYTKVRDKMHFAHGDWHFLTDKEYRHQKYGLELGIKRYE